MKKILIVLVLVLITQFAFSQNMNDVDLAGKWEFAKGSIIVFQSNDGWNYVGVFEKVNEKWSEKGWVKGELLFKVKREEEGSNVYIGKYRRKSKDEEGNHVEKWKSITFTVNGITLNPGNAKKIG